jgi:DNA mismatch endonuclease, patch repair protein
LTSGPAKLLANRSTDNVPERALRSALHRRGLRFRKNLLVRVSGYRAIRPDVVFTRARVAVFVDGCFWHACSEHGTWPRTNSEFWRLKLERNIERDCQVDQALTAGGWQVVRVWEHEDPNAAASRIKAVLTGHLEKMTSVTATILTPWL